MKALAERKRRLRVVTSDVERGRPVIVELCPGHIELREKGRRHGYVITWHRIYVLAAQLEAERQRDERRARRVAVRATSGGQQ